MRASATKRSLLLSWVEWIYILSPRFCSIWWTLMPHTVWICQLQSFASPGMSSDIHLRSAGNLDNAEMIFFISVDCLCRIYGV